MKNRIIYEICKLQNINHLYEKYQNKTRVYCPYCGERKARVDGGKWECKPCHKTGTAFELLKLVEEDYCEQHSMV